MSDLRGIEADYVNWRTVTGRKALQLVFEVDISRQEEVLKMLGAPSSDTSKPCAIALLDMKAVKAESQESAANGHPKKWSEYPRSQQCAILCSDEDFQRYFGTVDGAQCDRMLKAQLRIASKRELDTDADAGKRFDEVCAIYNLHRDRLR